MDKLNQSLVALRESFENNDLDIETAIKDFDHIIDSFEEGLTKNENLKLKELKQNFHIMVQTLSIIKMKEKKYENHLSINLEYKKALNLC